MSQLNLLIAELNLLILPTGVDPVVDGNQLTTDSAISLSRQASSDSSATSSTSTKDSDVHSDHGNVPRKTRPKLPPLSVCEEMNRKGFKNWSRGVKSDRKILGQMNSAPIQSAPIRSILNSPVIKPKSLKSGSIIPSTMSTNPMSDKMKDNWIKNHDGQWIKNDQMSENVRNVSYKKRISVGMNLPKSANRRASVMTTIFGQGGGRRFSQDLRRFNLPDEEDEDSDGRSVSPEGQRSPTPIKSYDEIESETAKVIFFQVFIPFLVAGFGNVGAGLILDKVIIN